MPRVATRRNKRTRNAAIPAILRLCLFVENLSYLTFDRLVSKVVRTINETHKVLPVAHRVK